jgi:hypothetical protein
MPRHANDQAPETVFEEGDAALIIKADLSITLVLPTDEAELSDEQQLQQRALLALAQAVQEEDIMQELFRRMATRTTPSESPRRNGTSDCERSREPHQLPSRPLPGFQGQSFERSHGDGVASP